MTRILILGAGFGGLELSSSLSETLGDSVSVTLIDKSDAFVFGTVAKTLIARLRDHEPRRILASARATSSSARIAARA